MHYNMVESVQATRDSQEWADDEIQQMLTQRMVRGFEESSMLCVVHH